MSHQLITGAKFCLTEAIRPVHHQCCREVRSVHYSVPAVDAERFPKNSATNSMVTKFSALGTLKRHLKKRCRMRTIKSGALRRVALRGPDSLLENEMESNHELTGAPRFKQGVRRAQKYVVTAESSALRISGSSVMGRTKATRQAASGATAREISEPA